MAKVIEKIELPKRDKKAILKDIKVAEAKLKELIAEDRTEYAQDIIDKMFAAFGKGHKWTTRMSEMVKEKMYVYSSLGRKRFMPAVLTGIKSIISQQVRRGSNAPVQGMASEIGVKAGRVILESYYNDLSKMCELLELEGDEWDWRVLYNRIVHDANYYSVPLQLAIPFTHIAQYDATYGVTKAYKKEFDIEFTVEPEIEMEFGACDSDTTKWKWSIPEFAGIMIKSVNQLNDRDLLPDGWSVKKALRVIFVPWKNKACRKFLQTKYPLLNVPDLDDQIDLALKVIDDYCRGNNAS